MTESIVVIRLTRNLRYKLTYVHIFETYLEGDPSLEVRELIEALIQTQQAAIAPLSRYLRRLDVNTQDLELDQKLLGHALARDTTKARLRFIHDGLKRAVSWYKMQLADRQMSSDDELRELLVELGESDAAKLWYTEVVMAMLRIPTQAKEKEWEEPYTRKEPERRKGWQPHLVEDVDRPTWGGSRDPQLPRPRRYRREDSG